MSHPTHLRLHTSLLAASEKRLLIWIAERLPRRIHSDHLSTLGLASMAGAGGIIEHCKHRVPFGVVEAINGNIRSVIRRGRGYKDHEYLILKVRKATASARSHRAA